MGFQYSALKSKVEITGGVTLTPFVAEPNDSQTLKHFVVVGNDANQTAYTVTAGKTFYLMGLLISNPTSTASSFKVLENDDSEIFNLKILAETAIPISSLCPIHAYTSEQNVRVWITAGQKIQGWGYEV